MIIKHKFVSATMKYYNRNVLFLLTNSNNHNNNINNIYLVLYNHSILAKLCSLTNKLCKQVSQCAVNQKIYKINEFIAHFFKN